MISLPRSICTHASNSAGIRGNIPVSCQVRLTLSAVVSAFASGAAEFCLNEKFSVCCKDSGFTWSGKQIWSKALPDSKISTSTGFLN